LHTLEPAQTPHRTNHPLRDESEQEVIRRLEAFSDIVIGFSLAQLALSLTMPERSASQLFLHVRGTSSLLGFGITFVLICALWWTHHRLFRQYFVPTAVGIVLNFAALGGVVFLAYALQVFVHFGMRDTAAFLMYTGSYGYILAIFATLIWIGLHARGARMEPRVRSKGIEFATHISIAAAGLTAVSIAAGLFGLESGVAQWMLLAVALPVAASRIYKWFRRKAVNSPSV
jgi:uncharacterized membrane protein